MFFTLEFFFIYLASILLKELLAWIFFLINGMIELLHTMHWRLFTKIEMNILVKKVKFSK